MSSVRVTCAHLVQNDLVMAFFDTKLKNTCVDHFGNSSHPWPVVVF